MHGPLETIGKLHGSSRWSGGFEMRCFEEPACIRPAERRGRNLAIVDALATAFRLWPSLSRDLTVFLE
jgi:hypothetical protein